MKGFFYTIFSNKITILATVLKSNYEKNNKFRISIWYYN